MKQRRIFVQLVNQWQEEAKEDFKAQKWRLGMQKSGLQRKGIQRSPESKGGAGCSAPKWASAHQNMPSFKNVCCNTPEGLQRAQNVPKGWTHTVACPRGAAARQKGPGMCPMRCSAPKSPVSEIPLPKMRAATLPVDR